MTAPSKSAQVHDELADRTPLFTAWFASWADVRREFETVLEAYEQRHSSYDPGWIEPVLEMMDKTLSNLAYRVQWLQTNLDRNPDELPDTADEATHTRL